MSKPKTKRITVYVDRGFNINDEVLKMSFKDLKNYLGGQVAVGLFQGKFDQAIYDALYVAEQWGENAYHQRLVNGDEGA